MFDSRTVRTSSRNALRIASSIDDGWASSCSTTSLARSTRSIRAAARIKWPYASRMSNGDGSYPLPESKARMVHNPTSAAKVGSLST